MTLLRVNRNQAHHFFLLPPLLLGGAAWAPVVPGFDFASEVVGVGGRKTLLIPEVEPPLPVSPLWLLSAMV